MGFSPSGPVKANRGVRARVPAAGKVLEGDDKPTLSALYYDAGLQFLSYTFMLNGGGLNPPWRVKPSVTFLRAPVDRVIRVYYIVQKSNHQHHQNY